MTAPTRRRLKAACETLAAIDFALARAYAVIGVPDWRSGEASYALLSQIVAHQQISVKAGAAIWARVEARLGTVTPEAVLETSEADLRATGLSQPKVAHLRSIAEAILSGGLNLERVAAASVGEARAELLAVRGIGPWTAELFLLYATGATDAFPVADVGLMEAYRQLSGAESRLEPRRFMALAETWRPHRGVAAHLLWGWLNAQRARDAAPGSG